MAKKFNISLKDDNNKYQLFGINTILKDYQLCSLINNFFSIETHLLETINNEISIFGDIIDGQKVILVQNQYQNKTSLFPKLKTFEYIVIVNNSDDNIENIIKTFETKDEILYISKILNKHLSTKGVSLIHRFLEIL